MRRPEILCLLVLVSTLTHAHAEPPPFSLAQACRYYLETLNPISAARELYARGELNAWVHPLQTLRRLDRAYNRSRDSEHNRRALVLETQLLAKARLDHTVPVHADDAENRAIARSQGLQYHVVVKARRTFFVDEEGVVTFPRGWALFLDPRSQIVMSIRGPRGETDIPRRALADDDGAL